MNAVTAASRRSARVYALAARERRIERIIAVFAIGAPTIGAGLALVTGVVWGVGWTELLFWLVGHTLTAIGIAIGYHRFASHGAFTASPSVKSVLVILGSTCLEGPVIWWAAIHRRHHASSDRTGDPHSPWIGPDGPYTSRWRGFLHSHVGWLFRHENTDWMHYVPELLKDRLMFRLSQLYFVWAALGLVLPAALGALIIGGWRGAVVGLLWGGFLRIFTTQHATWGTNSLGHLFGSRPFACRDQSRNSWLMALPTMGDSFHNHHHAFPTTAINQFEWWQIDLGGALIRALQAVGLVRDVHFPSREVRENYRRELEARAQNSEGAST